MKKLKLWADYSFDNEIEEPKAVKNEQIFQEDVYVDPLYESPESSLGDYSLHGLMRYYKDEKGNNYIVGKNMIHRVDWNNRNTSTFHLTNNNQLIQIPINSDIWVLKE